LPLLFVFLFRWLIMRAVVAGRSQTSPLRCLPMGQSPLHDAVATQYSRWMYPEPITDLPAWLKTNWQWFDPSHAHRQLWPDRDPRVQLDILIAGCGTNQAAVFAYNNPGSSVVAIDVSEPSLAHHRALADQYNLANLELLWLPIEEVSSLNRKFDLIVSTGVLHHLRDPGEGAKALAVCLKPDGVLALMLYARYGRLGVEMLQGIFRELGLQQNDVSLLMVKDALAALPDHHPLKGYLACAHDLNFDAGLVDTFLHGRDRSYTVGDCLDLVEEAGLAFQDWFLKASYYASAQPDNAFLTAVSALPQREQWAVMERLQSQNACHFFTATPKERPAESYVVDFQSPQAREYRPRFRFRCQLEAGVVVGYGRQMSLNAMALALVQQIDGHRTVSEIVQAALAGGVLPRCRTDVLEQQALELFASLWKRDLLEVQFLTPPPAVQASGDY
jgi:SAM-dependent methyltransferase